jgi:tetratricopeptide (TPR) repeat protein
MLLEQISNPFPGLRPFETDEGRIFFGRDEQSRELVARLRRRRLLAVVGTSGSGKSSLVRAGLVPRLHDGSAASPERQWRVATMRPGENPMHALALALNGSDVLGNPERSEEEAARDATLLEVRLKRSGLGLIEVVRLARLHPDQKVLILIDQFEELFRFAGVADNRSDAAAFVKLILEATPQTELPIYVALTMRSDFIGDCSHFRDLPEAVAAGLYLIPRLTRQQRRAAIEEPVRLAGGDISRRLVNGVLNDIGEDPDQLPVMQHALMRTWDHWKTRLTESAHEQGPQPLDPKDHPLDLEDYLAIGGAAQALSNHAEEAYGALDAGRQVIAKRMFQCLTEKGPDNREIRRPTKLTTIAEVAGATASEVIEIVEEFRKPKRSFLMPPPGVALDDNSVIDISHESLVRHWKRLSDWVEEEAESAKSYRHLAETAALHEQGQAGLWGDPDLANYLAWKQRVNPTKFWAERYQGGFSTAIRFLEHSRSARDAALHLRNRLRFALVAATIAVIAGLSGLATFAFIKENQAVQKEREADEARESVAQVARLSRQELSDIRQREESNLGDLFTWTSPAWSPYLYRRRAAARMSSGDYIGARNDLDEAKRAQPNYLPALVSSSDLCVVQGNADAAVRDSRAYLKEDKTNAVAYGNLILGEAMRRKYGEAIAAIDEALSNARLPISDTESFVAPDVQRLTYNFRFSANDSDFLLALRYLKATFYAMSGDERFEAELESTDRADRDYPYSREAYLLALNWQWLTIRGQVAYDLQRGDDTASTPGTEFKDYGAYAVEGALWDKIARTRPASREWAIRAYEKFRNAYANNRDDRYKLVAAWVEQQLVRKIAPVSRDEALLERARDLALQAQELKKGASSASRLIELARAHERLSDAINLLEGKKSAQHLGRREQDLLVRLLLRRAEWRLQGEDKGGARDDAQAALAISPNSVDAYRLLASAAFDERMRRENDERVLERDPYNDEALSDLAEVYERGKNQADTKTALALLQKRARVSQPWSADYLRMARLQSQLGLYEQALQNLENAISSAPWRINLYEERRKIEMASKGGAERAALRFAEGLRAVADFQARTGGNAPALRAYVRAFRQATLLSPADQDAAFELETTIRNLSSFVTARYGAEDAQWFWLSLAQDPLLDERQKQLAQREARRLSQRQDSR